jgi:hypothetical protein
MNDSELNSFISKLRDRNPDLNLELMWFLNHPLGLWLQELRCGREIATKIAIETVEFILPEWQQKRSKDTVPVRAVEAARILLIKNTKELREHAVVLAKGCTRSRQKSLGYEHRIAEAARAVAHAATAIDDSESVEAAAEALAKTEEHLLYRFAVNGVYHKEQEVRKGILDCIAC